VEAFPRRRWGDRPWWGSRRAPARRLPTIRAVDDVGIEVNEAAALLVGGSGHRRVDCDEAGLGRPRRIGGRSPPHLARLGLMLRGPRLQKLRSTSSPSPSGRWASWALRAGRANFALKSSRNSGTKGLAASMVEMPRSLSSFTRRSWRVWCILSTRPLACGALAQVITNRDEPGRPKSLQPPAVTRKTRRRPRRTSVSAKHPAVTGSAVAALFPLGARSPGSAGSSSPDDAPDPRSEKKRSRSPNARLRAGLSRRDVQQLR
jgi:hypothetical protein